LLAKSDRNNKKLKSFTHFNNVRIFPKADRRIEQNRIINTEGRKNIGDKNKNRSDEKR